MNEEQKAIALWIRKHAEKLIADLPERLKVAQAAEDREAQIVGRMPQRIRFEPLVEIPTPVLAGIVGLVGDKINDDVKGHVESYRRHCEMWPNSGTTNVRAEQLLAVLDAAGVKEQPAAPAPKEKLSA